ncbi:MAG: hypothetical protein RL177_535 [Bacteroidota bacterium]|jgi:hypothetical protein
MMLLLLLWLQAFGDPSLGHQNQYPLFRKWMTSVPQPIAQESGFGWRLTQRYTAMNYRVDGRYWRYDLDMEISEWVADVSLRRGSFEWMLTVPASMQWGGFMDPFLNWYHTKLSLPNYNRDTQEPNRHVFRFEDEDGALWTESPGVWVLRAPVLSVHHDAFVPLTVSAKLPVFDADTWDVGIETRFMANNSPSSGVFGRVGGIWRQRGDAAPFSNIRSTPTFSLGYWTQPKRLTFVGEVSTYPSLFERTRLPKLEKQSIELVLGGHVPTPWGRLTLSFSEDLSYLAPDFTIGVRFTPEH